MLVYAPDQPDLFARICGYFDSAGFSILDAKVHTTRAGYALDTFQVVSTRLEPSDRQRLPRPDLAGRDAGRAGAGVRPARCPSRAAAACRGACARSRSRRASRCAPDERAQRWLLTVSASDRSGLLYAHRARAGAPPHQPAAGQDHDAGRARRRHLPDRRPGLAAAPHAVADRDRTARRGQRRRDAAVAHASTLRACRRDAPRLGRLRHRHRRALARASSRGTTCPARVNWPMLNDARARARSAPSTSRSRPFDARKRGAAMVARNIAAPRRARTCTTSRASWQPLVYCWRGGQRCGALALVLDQIGFQVHVLEGGYRDSAAPWCAELETLPATLRLPRALRPHRLGKSRLLQALHDARRAGAGPGGAGLPPRLGAGPAAGPAAAEPEAFESRVWQALRGFRPAARPVFVESESHKIGRLRVPEALIEQHARHGAVHAEWRSTAARGLPARGLRALRRRRRRLLRRLLTACVELRGRRRGRGAGRRWRERALAAAVRAAADSCTTTRSTTLDAQQLRCSWRCTAMTAGARATRPRGDAGSRCRRPDRRRPGTALASPSEPQRSSAAGASTWTAHACHRHLARQTVAAPRPARSVPA